MLPVRSMRYICTLLVLATAPVPASAAVQVAGPAAVADFLQAIGGIALTADERRTVVAEQSALAARDPKWRREWSDAARGLRDFARASGEDRAAARHKWRAGFHFDGKDTPAAYAIVARRDPVFVEDGARREVVSRADYRALVASNAFMGRLAGMAPPAAAETPEGIASIRREYMRDANLRAVLTQAQVRYALSQRLWQAFRPADRSRIQTLVREKVKSPAMVADAARAFENECVSGYVKAVRGRGSGRSPAVQQYAVTADYYGFMRGMTYMKF